MVTGKSAAATQGLRQILDDCMEAAQKLGAKLEVELTEAVEMESECTIATVHFVENGSNENSLNLRLMLDQLEDKTVVAAINLFPPPQARLVIHGGLKNRSYRIAVHLENASAPT